MARREKPEAWQRLMDQKGMASFRELGDAAGLSHTAVSRIAYGQSKHVRDTTVRAIADALGQDMETIYELINQPVEHASPWSPPAESQRLTRRQRNALEELVRSMAEKPQESPMSTTRSTNPDDKAAEVVATMAEVAGITPGPTVEDTIAALPEDMRAPTMDIVRLIREGGKDGESGATVHPLFPAGDGGAPHDAAADAADGPSTGQRARAEADARGEESQDPGEQP